MLAGMTTDKLLLVGLAWTGLLLGLVLLRIVLRRSTGAGAARALPVVTLLTAVMVLAVGAMAVVRVDSVVHPPTTVAEGLPHDGGPSAAGPNGSVSPSDGSAASPAPPASPAPTAPPASPAPPAPPTERSSLAPASSAPSPQVVEPAPASTEPSPAPRARPVATETPTAPEPTGADVVATPSARPPTAVSTAPPTPAPAATPFATPLPMQEPVASAAPPAVAVGPGTLTLPARVRVYSVEGGQVSGFAASSLARRVTVRGIGPGQYPMPTLDDPSGTTQLVLVSEGKLLGKLVSLDDSGVTFTPD